ncbi:choline/carnitine o-acyltransferase [Nitzschia inconspicua]|uniref:Choline/carnitine o-acyltransferase n=1 Tax=Nitzschia inconspicua TaxID=303405 RepID=A0A9K3L3L5_9STRA|nr:choline/carnitine o-acyltransferase [Nitzschia inconspicua]
MTATADANSSNGATPARMSMESMQQAIDTAHRTLDTQISALSDRDSLGKSADYRTASFSPVSPARALNSISNRQDDSVAATSETDINDDAKTSVTYCGQRNLPPLPIPSLEETLNKFLKSIEALQESDEQKETAKRVVLEFLNGDGPKLQKLLVEYDRDGRENGLIGSYVEEFWNDSYLAPDSSVVLNLNPYFLLESTPDPKLVGNQIRRAASLCFASCKLASQLQKETFKPDTFRGKPLCMDQFRALFGASRVPKRNSKDSIAVYDRTNHVAVMCCNQLYYFQALWPDGDVAVDERDLCDILEAIHAHAHKFGKDEHEDHTLDEDDLRYLSSLSAVGVLTSLSRNEWATVREEMIVDSPVKNFESFTIVDSALFVLVLDDCTPPDKHAAAANMLHGSYELSQRKNQTNGSNTKTFQTRFLLPCEQYQSGSCTNRWYDKLQVIVTKDGNAGINFEHSAIDGHTALRFVSDIYADTIISFAQSITQLVQAHDGVIPSVITAKVKRAAVTLDSQGRTTLDVFPKKINFDLSESVRRKIHYAETALGDEIVASDSYFLEFKDYGKRFITANKLSPDSYVQMSMMIAYYKLYGKMVCAYEPVLSKSFYHGRTEAMRPATMEAKHLCEVFCNPKSSPDEKSNALRNAVRVHSALVKECARGKGVDRHLFALKCIAEKNGVPVPDFFKSEAWKMLNHTILSTSNCGNPSLALFGFGPVVPNGLGIGYIIKDACLHYAICSKHRQTKRYAMTLEAVLKQMAKLLAPLSQTTVRNHHRSPSQSRMSLKQIPVNAISYDAYGDIWGESTPPRSPKVVEDMLLPSIPLFEGSTLSNHSTAPLFVEPLGVAQEGRWSAEASKAPHGKDMSDSDTDDILDDEELEKGSTKDIRLDLKDIESPQVQRKFKRRGSNDKLPTRPSRRGSAGNAPTRSRSRDIVGYAQRQSSFELAELSKKGDSIVFEKAIDP